MMAKRVGRLIPSFHLRRATPEMTTNRLRALTTGLPATSTLATIFHSLRFCSAQPQETDSDGSDLDNCLANHSAGCSGPGSHGRETTWDDRYRRRADEVMFGREVVYRHDQGDEKRQRMLAKALLEAAIDEPDEEVVEEEHQKSLAVGIIGAPNAGKSSLTNFMVGRKVAAVSRKTNTTVHEVLGVLTKGTTQICLFDTPGLMLNCRGFPHKDLKFRVENTWGAVNLYDVLIVLFDVHRHLTRPDGRVINLIQRMGAQTHSEQKRVLCMNKVDLVEKKKDLLRVSEQFKDLPGYERYFMISGLKGFGVEDLTQYLIDQAVERPWDDDPFKMSEEVMKNISMEVVREKLLNYVHQEIPYQIEHRMMDWKELRDGSLRIEHHLITHKESQRRILVGKKGSKIGTIGVEANEELRNIYKRDVHLILQVRVK